ncbi:MAG: LysE family transporter [Bacteroidota bacterium]
MVVKGLLLGLSLAVLTGPLLFTLLQATLEGGQKAGFKVAGGIWISDALFIVGTVLAYQQIRGLVDSPAFDFLTKILGGFVFLSFGFALLFSSGQKDQATSTALKSGGYWLAGFLVNTINPFTVVFWTTLAGTMLIENQEGIVWFYGALFGSIVVTDSLKVLGAHWLRTRLTPNLIRITRMVAGLVVIGFGLWLLVQFWW